MKKYTVIYIITNYKQEHCGNQQQHVHVYMHYKCLMQLSLLSHEELRVCCGQKSKQLQCRLLEKHYFNALFLIPHRLLVLWGYWQANSAL